MNGRTARCSILVLSEDSARESHETIVTLAKKMLVFIDPGCQTQHIRFEPPEGELVRQAIRGNLWKSCEPRDYEKRRALIGYIATKLLEGDTSFIFYHIDGDRPWSARDESENASKFLTFIETDVRQFVEHRRRQKGLAEGIDLSLAQLLLIIPFYSIESWLFQNTREALRLCINNESCRGAHAERLKQWEENRAELDEIVKPKEALCFGARHNLLLAKQGFDADVIYFVGKSFTETVDRMTASAPLVSALEKTHPL